MLLFGDDMVPPMAAAMPAREPQPETPAGKASVNLVLPAPLTECTVEDVVRLCTGMKTCIARHEKNKAYMSEEFEGLNLARGDLMQRVKQYVRNYRDSADPDGFLRRVDDFFPMQDELPEIQTLKGVVAELLSKDRLTMLTVGTVRRKGQTEALEASSFIQDLPKRGGVIDERTVVTAEFAESACVVTRNAAESKMYA